MRIGLERFYSVWRKNFFYIVQAIGGLMGYRFWPVGDAGRLAVFFSTRARHRFEVKDRHQRAESHSSGRYFPGCHKVADPTPDGACGEAGCRRDVLLGDQHHTCLPVRALDQIAELEVRGKRLEGTQKRRPSVNRSGAILAPSVYRKLSPIIIRQQLDPFAGKSLVYFS